MASTAKPGLAMAVAGAVTLSAGAMIAMQQDSKKKEGSASIYKEDAPRGQSDLSTNSSDVTKVVEGKIRGKDLPTQVQK